MKKIINRMLAASILSAGIVACDKAPSAPETPQQGDATTMTLALALNPTDTGGGTTTRATTNDANGTAAEAELHTADVYIYDGTTGAYLKHVHLVAADFAQQASIAGADVWDTTSPDKIATTTGSKTFLVGVNLPASAASSLESQSLSAAGTIKQQILRANITTLQASGIPMFSTTEITATMQQDATQNKVTIPVERIVAKVTVEKSTNPVMQQDGTQGTLGPLTWTINNQNSWYFLMQGNPSPYADPNWTAGSYNASDFADAASDTEYVAVADGQQNPVSNYQVLYALENTADQKLMKELTRVTIRATFIPARWVTSYTKGNGTATDEANANYQNGSPQTFYTVVEPVPTAKTTYFQNLQNAQDYGADKSQQVNTYTGGYCYWNVFMNKQRKGEVVRNDYYQLNITRIVAPGQTSAALKDPDKPAPTDTSVTADVNVLNWHTPTRDNVELVP